MTDEITTTGRRGFMVGAAGLAAGAALLANALPAGAQTLEDHDFSADLKSQGSTLEDVDLGDGGAIRADFVAEGDVAAMTIRAIVGADADVKDGVWTIFASDFPVGYEPAELPDVADPMTPSPFPMIFGWIGVGLAINGGNSVGSLVLNQLQRPPGQPTFFAWGVVTGTGVGGFNEGGDNPFELTEGSLLTSTIVYRRIVPEV